MMTIGFLVRSYISDHQQLIYIITNVQSFLFFRNSTCIDVRSKRSLTKYGQRRSGEGVMAKGKPLP